MQKIKLTIEYDGTDFYGWQKQKNLPTVQGLIENSLEKFFGIYIEVFVAGRTDKGVHAIGQVAHFDIELTRKYNEHQIMIGLNNHLKPNPISITKVEFAEDGFHARFSVKKKSYIYKIINRKSTLTFQKKYAWHVIKKIDIEKLFDTSKFLLGTHDFESFRGPDCKSKSSIRTIDDIIINKNDDEISIEFQAKSFLHNQIRIMVGTLKKISIESSELKADYIKNIINGKNRILAGETAPGSGLFLKWIKY